MTDTAIRCKQHSHMFFINETMFKLGVKKNKPEDPTRPTNQPEPHRLGGF